MRRPSLGIAVLVSMALAPLAMLAACSSKADLVGPGGDCQLASDCQADLICIEQKDGNRTCDNDLSKAQPKPPESKDAATPKDAATDGDATADDTGTEPDTSPGADTSPPPDTSPPADTSVPDTAVPDTSVPDTAAPDSAGAPDAAAG